jgi:uncharacterized protein (TIGR02996 family)
LERRLTAARGTRNHSRSTLETVREAVGVEDYATGLADALELWREERAPWIGDAIRWLDQRLTYSMPASGIDAFQAQWLAAARLPATPLRSGFLARYFLRNASAAYADPDWERLRRGEVTRERDWERQQAARYAILLERIDLLVQRRPDPRFGDAAFAMLRGAKASSIAAYRNCARLLVHHGDWGHRERARGLLDEPRARSTALREQLAELLLTVIDGLSKLPRVDEAGRARWEEIFGESVHTHEPQMQSAEALLARVYSEPFDHELRAVCADRLQDIGSPRGELIALQLLAKPGPDAKRRIRALIAAHQEEWMGPALSLVLKSVRFTHGFPTTATLAARHEATDEVWAAARVDRRLATLEHLHRGRAAKHLHEEFLDIIAAMRTGGAVD